jgi:hypothetical protein
MKYLAIVCFCLCSFLSFSQHDDTQPPLNDLDFEGLRSLDFDFKDLESLDLNFNFDELFGQLDSLPLQFGQFGDIQKLFGDQLSDLSQNEELFQDLLDQSFKTLQNFDMDEIQGLMDNFMKDFEGLNLEDMIDTEEVDKIMEKHAKIRKI